MTHLTDALLFLPVGFVTLAYFAGRGWLQDQRRETHRSDLPPVRLPEETGPTWYPPQPTWEAVRAERAERAGLLYCDDHDTIHPRETHCPRCYAEWAVACNEREVWRAIVAGEPYQHADGRWYADTLPRYQQGGRN